ncbi:nucleoside-diphosphate-sugar epimerase [Penicillium macrosclerotiorum]|uniref:nucleoside-diphosphate-sugar epimerase n=1 Tax=Penicillium macrosclerotiorum TaxID=303699 RepID=UPI002546800B|nr:nucleoside-diphosphate-sugar epimerase [Penicillium macrosclerotiorum]KAJ5666880.1 nucleoside-diphosphate-sugar epimerase [Penicillium macrosclerotiorum]
MTTEKQLVLVTGGSGFIGSHCIIQCLAAGYRVRTTVRSLAREEEVREMLRVGDAINLEDVSFVEADLNSDEGWTEAAKDCTYVLHVASPFPPAAPKHENDLIIPARDGTLRVLRAARDAKVKRIVVTSSMAAVSVGHQNTGPGTSFTEESWSNLDSSEASAYDKSKTLAERAAWDFIQNEGRGLEMSVINPSMVMGPVLAQDTSSSIEVIRRLISGEIPGCPRLEFGVVDVRDVASLHLLAMTHDKANGERFICMSPPSMTIQEMSLALRETLGTKAKKCPTRTIPNFVMRILGWFDPAIALVVKYLDEPVAASIDKAKSLLGWTPRSNVDSVIATAESLLRLGIVKQ